MKTVLFVCTLLVSTMLQGQVQPSSNVLFYNNNGGGTLTESTNFSTIGTYPFSGGWTHIVGVGDAKTLFYNANKGAATLSNNKDFSTISNHGFAGGWTHIVNLGNGRVLFYNSATALNVVTNNVNFGDERKFNFAGGWTHITNVGNGRILFYNANSGAATLTDNINFNTISTHRFSGWTHIVNLDNDKVLFYNANTNVATLTNSTNFSTISTHNFAGWTHITNIGRGRVLFYNAKTGVATVTRNDNFDIAISTHNFAQWTAVVPIDQPVVRIDSPVDVIKIETAVKATILVNKNIIAQEIFNPRALSSDFFSFKLFEVISKPSNGFPTCEFIAVGNVTAKYLGAVDTEDGRVYNYNITSPNMKLSNNKKYVLEVAPFSLKLTPKRGFQMSKPQKDCNGVIANGSVLKLGFSAVKIL